jgi:sec-independent protein translocase protein TatA
VFNIGPEELLLVLVIALIVFGPKRLPEIGRTVGKALREFRRASEGIREEINRHLDLEEHDDGFTGTYPIPERQEGSGDGSRVRGENLQTEGGDAQGGRGEEQATPPSGASPRGGRSPSPPEAESGPAA